MCFAENAATINAFEIVEDAGLTEEYASENTPCVREAQDGVRRVGPGEALAALASLNPYNIVVDVLKAKLASKGNVRTFRNAKGEGKVMTVEFVDEAGTAIQATMWKDAIVSSRPDHGGGQGVLRRQGHKPPANKKYSSVNNELRASLDGPLRDRALRGRGRRARAQDVPRVRPRQDDKLPLKIGGRASVDVVAIVTRVGELGS